LFISEVQFSHLFSGNNDLFLISLRIEISHEMEQINVLQTITYYPNHSIWGSVITIKITIKCRQEKEGRKRALS
jgi:hypothetical protein